MSRFPATHYGPETFALMGRAYDDAWREAQIMIKVLGPVADQEKIRSLLANGIIVAAAGERDPERLKLLALHEISTRDLLARAPQASS